MKLRRYPADGVSGPCDGTFFAQMDGLVWAIRRLEMWSIDFLNGIVVMNSYFFTFSGE